ncbi:hypothetical protein BJ878DRAFT_436448 [Calycina marina]|uniref:Zinc finger protein 830 n=1 Tax=Calycina marina TaxID=1763456 RepID=A0A9P7Z771_9HELO|nr:hypothetical protein BJ878DRAFT_436448 [Calycina marina]
MADVRSLLKSERAARRIQHPAASYSLSGTLICTICHLQLKSDTLWEPHLKSASHIQKSRAALLPPSAFINSKKRKASPEADEGADTIRKRTKAASNNGIPDGFFGKGSDLQTIAAPLDTKEEIITPPIPVLGMSIPSRPATPSTAPPPQRTTTWTAEMSIDEDEWTAFEAEIASTTQAQAYEEAQISAPAISAAEIAAKAKEEDQKRWRERQEAELEGDKEDAARKLEGEWEEMAGLEERVRRLREKREALRKVRDAGGQGQLAPLAVSVVEGAAISDDEAEDEDDEWDGFRMKG